MRPCDADAVAALAERLMGRGYYSADQVRDMLARSTCDDRVYSYVAVDGAEAVGARFSLPPGAWSGGRGRGLSPDRWPVPLPDCGYFQTSFVDPAHRGRGIGPALARLALDDLRRAGARAVIAHAWKESPDDSARRYLSRLGFVAVCEHPEYWVEVDYVCPRDGQPCRCTAVEMVLDLRARPDHLGAAE